MILTGCFGSKASSSAGRGGEVVGVGGRSFAEPAPYGMVKVARGYLRTVSYTHLTLPTN